MWYVELINCIRLLYEMKNWSIDGFDTHRDLLVGFVTGCIGDKPGMCAWENGCCNGPGLCFIGGGLWMDQC